jgi:hypothetical protein
MNLLAAALAVAVLTTSQPIVAQKGGRLEPVQSALSQGLTPELAVMMFQRCTALFEAQSQLVLTRGKSDWAAAFASKATHTASAFRHTAMSVAEKYRVNLDETAMDTAVEQMRGAYVDEFALTGAMAPLPFVGTLKADHDFCMSLDRR